jgi:hypothetical protein
MKILPLIALLSTIADTAIAGSMGGVPNTMGLQATDPALHGGVYKSNPSSLPPKTRALLQLRQEGLKLQEGDGGTLTSEHRAYLQQKLDSIQTGDY